MTGGAELADVKDDGKWLVVERNDLHASDESVLLETRMGFYAGTWLLPVPYEGSVWDRLFSKNSGSDWRSNAHVMLTPSTIVVDRLVGGRSEIPLDKVFDVYLCACVGNKYWGRERVLRIVWERGDKTACTAIVIMPFAKPKPKSWKQTIENQPGFGEATTRRKSDFSGVTSQIRRNNGRITSLFVTSLVVFVTLLVFQELGAFGNYRPLSPHTSWLMLLALGGMLWIAEKLYNKRFAYLGTAPAKGLCFAEKVLAILIVMWGTIMLLVWLLLQFG